MSDDHDMNEHHTLERRVTGLEKQVEHIASAVQQTSEDLRRGFTELRHFAETSQERANMQTQQIHERINSLNEREMVKGQVSWPLVISCILLALTLIASGAAYVTMTTEPTKLNVAKLDHIVDRHINEGGHASTDIAIASIREQIESLRSTVRNDTALTLDRFDQISTQLVELRQQNNKPSP